MSKSSVEIANCRAYALLRTLYETRGQRIEELAAICEKLEAEVERLQEKLEATKGQLRYSGDPFYDDAADAAKLTLPATEVFYQCAMERSAEIKAADAAGG